MASFAIHVDLIHALEDCYFERFTRGDLEGVFLQKFAFTKDDFEAKASNCTRV